MPNRLILQQMTSKPFRVTPEDVRDVYIICGYTKQYAVAHMYDENTRRSLAGGFVAKSSDEAVDCVCVMIMSAFIGEKLPEFYREYLQKIGLDR